MQGNVQTSTDAPRRPGRLRGLIALNAALVTILAAVTFGPGAEAQMRSRGNYTMVAGNAKNANAAVVYIVDSVNQEMVAVTYNNQNKALEGVGYANLAQDAVLGARGR